MNQVKGGSVSTFTTFLIATPVICVTLVNPFLRSNKDVSFVFVNS